MLLLIYFHRLRGSEIYITEPKNLLDHLKENHAELIKGLLDFSDEGFFTHYFSKELKTVNYIFYVDSPWARGYSELLMLSVIISEVDPDIQTYEKIFTRFIKKMQQRKDIYKAFYVNSLPADKRQDALNSYNFLKKQLEDIYKILSIRRVGTEGCLYSCSKIIQERAIFIPKDIINKINNLCHKHGKDNFFMVFRTRGDTVKIDLIPTDGEKIVKLMIIFGDQMTIKILQNISEIFSKYNKEVKLIFTSGICQEIDKCIYEVYIDVEESILEKVINEIYVIPGVIEIDIKFIILKK